MNVLSEEFEKEISVRALELLGIKEVSFKDIQTVFPEVYCVSKDENNGVLLGLAEVDVKPKDTGFWENCIIDDRYDMCHGCYVGSTDVIQFDEVERPVYANGDEFTGLLARIYFREGIISIQEFVGLPWKECYKVL